VNLSFRQNDRKRGEKKEKSQCHERRQASLNEGTQRAKKEKDHRPKKLSFDVSRMFRKGKKKKKKKEKKAEPHIDAGT